jgi:hypothetical protein
VGGARLPWWAGRAAAPAGLAVGLATLPVQHAWLHLPSHHEHEH